VIRESTSTVIKHKAVLWALLVPPIATLILRNTGVISVIADEWMCSIWILGYVVVLGLYHAQDPKPDPK